MNNHFHIVTLELILHNQGKTRYGSKTVMEKHMEMWRDKAVTCHRINSFPLAKLPMTIEIVLWLLYAPLKTVELHNRQQCHVVLCSTHDFFNLWPAFIASKILKIPYATIVHHLTGAELEEGFIKQYEFRLHEGFKGSDALFFALTASINQKILSKSRRIVAVSNATREQLSKIGIKQVKVIHNGIEIPWLSNSKFMGNVKKTKKYDSVYVGRLSPDKGILDMIKIWKTVVKKKPKAKLLIIGAGLPYYIQKIRQLIERYTLQDNVTLGGVIKDEDKISLLSRSKVLVLPSHNEGFCFTISEALSTGCTVITYELPSTLEIYGHCPAIFYVRKGDYDEFADTIVKLLQKDNSLRMELEKKTINFAKLLQQKFSWECTSNELLLFLKSIASSAQGLK